jgi:hypothetical protein
VSAPAVLLDDFVVLVRFGELDAVGGVRGYALRRDSRVPAGDPLRMSRLR